VGAFGGDEVGAFLAIPMREELRVVPDFGV